MELFLNISKMNKFYKFFFYFSLSVIAILIIFITSYKFFPHIISKNLLNKIISHNTKIEIRKYFIEKNLKKHINTYSKNQFI